MHLKAAFVIHQNDQTSTLKHNVQCKSFQNLCVKVLQCCLLATFMKKSKDTTGMSSKVVSEQNGEMRRKQQPFLLFYPFFFFCKNLALIDSQ